MSVAIWRLRPSIRLPASSPLTPPLSVVFTLWLSMMPAVGWDLRFPVTRAASTSLRSISSSRPVSRQAWKSPRTVETGGKSLGNIRHWQPVGAMQRIASNTSRNRVVRGRPVALRGGIKGAISAHSASVRSLAYLLPARACWRRVSSVRAIVTSVRLRNRTESQPAELTQSVSNRALRAQGMI